MTNTKPGTTRPSVPQKFDPLYAFSTYVSMGGERSIAGLHKILQAKGMRVARNTLADLAKENDWENAAKTQLAANTKAVSMLAESAVSHIEVLGDDDDQVEFSTLETLEATANNLQAMACALSQVTTKQLSHYMNPGVRLDFAELVVLSKAAADCAVAAGNLYKAVNGEPAKPDPKLIDAEARRPDSYGPPGIEKLKSVFANPPMERPAPKK